MSMQIAKAIACPGKVAPMRFPSFPALERTAVMGFNASIPYDVMNGSNDPLSSHQPDHIVLARSATFPLWGTKAFSSNEYIHPPSYGVTYLSTATEGSTADQSWTCVLNDVSGVWFGNNRKSGSGNPTVLDASPEIPRAVLGIDAGSGDAPFVYCPAGSNLLVSISNVGVAFNSTVTCEQWVAPGDIQGYPVLLKLSTPESKCVGVSHEVSSNCWIRFKAVAIELTQTISVAPLVSLGVCYSEAPPTFVGNTTHGQWILPDRGTRYYLSPLTMSPEFENSIIPWQSTRLNAVAALFTNVTKALNKEGTILWGRVSPSKTNPWRVSKSEVEQLHPAEKCFMGLQDGAYVYNPPSTDLQDFTNHTFRSFYNIGNGSLDNQPVYRLDSTAYVVHGFFTDPDGNTALAINLDYHLEFRNSSTLFQLGVAGLPLEALHAAQLGLLKAGLYFNNDSHISVIQKIISALGSLHPILSVAAPVASGLLQASSLALSKRAKAKPPTQAKPTLPPRRQTQRRSRKKQTRPQTRVRATRSRGTALRALDAMDRMMSRRGRPAPMR